MTGAAIFTEPLAAAIGIGVIVVGALVGALNLTHGIAALIKLAREPQARRHLSPQSWRELEELAPSLAVVIPAFNEEATIEASVRAMLAVEYPGLTVLIVNDGSTDATVDVAIRAFGLRPLPPEALRGGEGPPGVTAPRHQPIQRVYGAGRVMLVDKLNGGKADALNAGIMVSDADCICVVDADTVLERTALYAAVRPFVEEPGQVLAVGGAIRIGNGLSLDRGHIVRARPPRRLIALLQTVEYLRTFHAARTAMGSFGAVGLISGAFGIFSREALVRVGGYERRTVGEDFELVLRLHRLALSAGIARAVRYQPDAVGWTEAPETLAVLSRQRRRWQRGALDTLSRHMGLVCNPRYGAVGMIALPESLLVDVVAPIATLLGYVVLPVATLTGVLSVDWLMAFIMLTAGLGLLHSAIGLALEDLRFRRFRGVTAWLSLLGAAVVEVCGYRQLCDFWRVQGMLDWVRGAQGWGRMERVGFRRAGDKPPDGAVPDLTGLDSKGAIS